MSFPPPVSGPEQELLLRSWRRLAPRIAASKAAGRDLLTVRARLMPRVQLPGAVQHEVYRAGGASRRSGEAERVRLFDLAPGARLRLPVSAEGGSLWIVLRGRLLVAGHALRRFEGLCRGGGGGMVEVLAPRGGRLLLREDAAPDAGDRLLLRPAAAGGPRWQRFGNGVSRRLLLPAGQPGPYLLHFAPGCRVPVHRHARDEECLMLAGEMYVEDQLLLAGDYQVAKAGGVHRSLTTDRGALVLVHGDPEPELLRAAGL